MGFFNPLESPGRKAVFRRARSVATDLEQYGVVDRHVYRVMEVEAEFRNLGKDSETGDK